MLIQTLNELILDKTLAKLQSIEAIPADKLQGARERLSLLRSLAGVHQAYASRRMRTDLEKAAKTLASDVQTVLGTIENSAWFIDGPLRMVSIDHYLQEKEQEQEQEQEPDACQQGRTTDERTTPFVFTEDLEQGLVGLSQALGHFRAMIGSYDKIKRTERGLLEWIEERSSLDGRRARADLSTYFEKGNRGVKPDTHIMRAIGQLYAYIFDRELPISAISSVELDKQLGDQYLQSNSDDSALPRYDGLGLQFAMAIINCFALEACFVELNDGSRDSYSFTPPQPNHPELVNRIGNTWKNDRQRRSKTTS